MKTNLSYAKLLGGIFGVCTCALLAPQSVQGTTINLNDSSVPGPEGAGTINGAIFTQTSVKPAGTFVLGPTLTLQGSPTEQGYNGTNGNFNTQNAFHGTSPIKLGSLAQVWVGGQHYYEFIVDVNEPTGSQSTISLNMLNVWTSPTTQSSTAVGGNGLFDGSLGTLRYSMSASLGTNSVLYDAANFGTTKADISIFIPVADFGSASATDKVYMYQAWGNTQSAQGGSEMTSYVSNTPVPEVSTFAPLAGILLVVVGLEYLRKRRKGADAVA